MRGPKRERCRIVLDVEGERYGPYCSIREAKRAVECRGKIRLVPTETVACARKWDVDCAGETIGSACDVPREIGGCLLEYDPDDPGASGLW